MFSGSSAPASEEQKGFKPHAPHFIPWLRNSLKPHHSSDLGLNRPYKSSSEVCNNLTQLERAKGIGFFSIQGRDRAKKGELRCNRVGMARMLPVMLRGHHILPGSLRKHRKDSPPGWNQSPELQPEPNMQMCPGDQPQGLSKSPASAQDNHTFVGTHSGQLNLTQPLNDGTSTLIRKYGALVGPPPAPEEANCKVPVVMAMEDKRGKVCNFGSGAIYQQRDRHASNSPNTETRGQPQRKHGFSSSFSSSKQKSRISKSHRDLTALRESPVEGFNGPTGGVIFSAEIPQRGLGHTATPRGSREAGPSLERLEVLVQNQTRVQHSPIKDGGTQRKEAGCTRKAVRNQIKRVVDNLEQVLRALRDIQQEMKEVVQQIDHLTSTIELNDEEQWRTTAADVSAELVSENCSSSDTSSSEATLCSTHQRCVKADDRPETADSSGTIRRNNHSRRQSPPNVLLCPVTCSSSSGRNLLLTSSPGSSSRHDLQLQYNNHSSSSNPPQIQNLASHDLTLSPQRRPPVRPPTPGLSPLTVNLHHPTSPASQPHSPGPSSSSIKVTPPSPPSPTLHPPPTFSAPVTIESKVGSYQAPPSDHPSVGQLSPRSTLHPSACCPPTGAEAQNVSGDDKERRASSAGPGHRHSPASAAPVATAKPSTGRRGRKPPPYPHSKPPEHTKKGKEPRKAPPYPEKRRLLLTTV